MSVKKIKCIYFPYAGCWSNDFIRNNPVWNNNNIEIICISYNVTVDTTWDEFINDIIEKIIVDIDDDYIIWGHSMGATVAYDVYYAIKNRAFLKQPLHIYVSSGIPPHKIEKSLANISNSNFEKEFLYLGEIRSEILKSKAILRLTMRLIKKDIIFLYKYNYEKHDEKMECPITVLFGKSDELCKYMYDWNDLPITICKNIFFEGDHFFIFNILEQFVELILKDYTESIMGHECLIERGNQK